MPVPSICLTRCRSRHFFVQVVGAQHSGHAKQEKIFRNSYYIIINKANVSFRYLGRLVTCVRVSFIVFAHRLWMMDYGYDDPLEARPAIDIGFGGCLDIVLSSDSF